MAMYINTSKYTFFQHVGHWTHDGNRITFNPERWGTEKQPFCAMEAGQEKFA